MKKEYSEPKVQKVELCAEDIITASGVPAKLQFGDGVNSGYNLGSVDASEIY